MIFTYWSKCANDGDGENQLCCVKEIIIANTASKLLRTVISMSPCLHVSMFPNRDEFEISKNIIYPSKPDSN